MRRLALLLPPLVLLVACSSNTSHAAKTATSAVATIVPATTRIATIAPTLAPTSTPSPTPSPAASPTSQPTPSPTPIPPTPTPTPRSAFATFAGGQGVVGQDLQPGTYRSGGGDGCYWERESGFSGSVDDILANDNAVGPAIVTIAPADKGFKSERCDAWTTNLAAITASPTAPFGDGTYIVPTDIAPGTWRSSGGAECYWARLAGFSGTTDDIAANDNTSGPAIVQIAPSDAGFLSRGCGMWTKIG